MLDMGPSIPDCTPSDRRISIEWRPFLEQCEIRFAPFELARRFSVDSAPYVNSFGFHGVPCYEQSDQSKLGPHPRLIEPHSPEWGHFMTLSVG